MLKPHSQTFLARRGGRPHHASLWETIQDANEFANAPSAPRKMTASSPRKPRPRSNSALFASPARLGCWLAAGILFLSLPARAQQVLPAWNAAAQQAWWTANPTPATWPKAADALQAQLESAYQQGGASSFSQPDFQGWMEHLEWIRLGLASPDALAKPEDAQAFVALGKDESVSHLFIRKLVPRDVKQAALQILLQLAEANMADLHEYAALGVAYAIVFDGPFPDDWPHAQVDPSAVPMGDLDVVKRFQFYVQANRAKKTELDLTQLSVDDLKYLVDSKVSLAELAYAENNQISYDHFADAFFSIKYDTARVSPQNQVFKWAQPTYKLVDIEKDGGICVDQAYYATTLGKGRGIPTIFFTGEGTDGGHAWFGYLSRAGKWELDCGRYESQNYPKGYALDPQTWQQVNDTTLANLAKNGGAQPNYQPAENAIAWARLHDGTPVYRQALDQARALMPELSEPWQDEGDYLETSKASLDDKKAFYKDWISQFESYADMKVEGQKRLLAALKAANDPDAASLQQDIVLQNRSTGFDLGVQGSLGAIEDKFKAQDWDGAKLEFEKAVRDFKDQGGGTFFYQVIRPYVMLCVQYGRPDQADDGLHFTEERMQIDSQSIIGIDFAKLKEELKLVNKALPDVQKWLGEVDDENYTQAWSDGSKPMQATLTSDNFVKWMEGARKPFGKCDSRTLSAAPQMGSELTGKSGDTLKGLFVELRYRGTFENNVTAEEKMVFSHEGDDWRELSYEISKQ